MTRINSFACATQYKDIDTPTFFLLLLILPLIEFNQTIMEAIKTTFAQCKKEQRSALVTYVTAGYPTADDTVDILLGMEAGGAGMSHLNRNFPAAHVSIRSHRTWSSFHRSHRRRPHNTESKYAGIEEWCHRYLHARDGQKCKEKGLESTGALHGLL